MILPNREPLLEKIQWQRGSFRELPPDPSIGTAGGYAFTLSPTAAARMGALLDVHSDAWWWLHTSI